MSNNALSSIIPSGLGSFDGVLVLLGGNRNL
jgi:hypothetical protein